MSQSRKCDSCFAFGEARYLDGGSLALDSQYRAFLFVQDGLATIRGDQGDDELRAGECAFYAGDHSFAICYPAGISTHLLWCKTLSPGVRFNDYPVSASSSHITASQELQTFFKLGLQLGTNTSTSANRLRDAIGEAIASAYFESTAEWSKVGIPTFVLEARAYADRHFSEPCDLTRLADSVGVTPQYLVSAFRKHLGITPVRYLWELRARRAASLVRETRLDLPDIAEQCGYKSHYHMSREIKRITGVSPRGLRL
jgi:AraC-like DNA-binding protein